MKTITKIMMLITLLVVVACNSNDTPDLLTPEETFGKVEFSFDVKENAGNDGGRKGTAGRTENVVPHHIVVSIENLDGDLVYDNTQLVLRNLNGGYFTDPIDLLVGSYQITEYYVEDESNNVIYITPQENSPLDHLVNDPLPIDFGIANDDEFRLSPEVVSPNGSPAEDFGYSSFDLNIVNTIDFLVSVHILDFQTTEYLLTTAAIQITADANTIYDSTLIAATNQVRVRDGLTNYNLSITKAGFASYNQTFDQATLESFADSPLIVVLDPVISNFEVFANDNSIAGGTGVSVGSFLIGEAIVFTSDPNDTWEMSPGDLIVNADGAKDPLATAGGLTSGVGLLVGSWDNGVTFLAIGVSEEVVVPADASLTLWCFDSDKDNNSGSITVSVQTYR